MCNTFSYYEITLSHIRVYGYRRHREGREKVVDDLYNPTDSNLTQPGLNLRFRIATKKVPLKPNVSQAQTVDLKNRRV